MEPNVSSLNMQTTKQSALHTGEQAAKLSLG